VDAAEEYNIIVYIRCKPPPNPRIDMIYNAKHSITWPEGDPIEELKFKININQLELQ